MNVVKDKCHCSSNCSSNIVRKVRSLPNIENLPVIELEDKDNSNFIPIKNAIYISNMSVTRRFTIPDSVSIDQETGYQFVTISNTESTSSKEHDIIWQLSDKEIIGVFSGCTQHWFIFKTKTDELTLISGPV